MALSQDNAGSSDSDNPAALRIVAVSAGASHTVALLSNKTVCSWGRGEDGQLGHGDAEERHLATIVSALDGCKIDIITSGADHTTAYSSEQQTVYSWGWGDFGRLGHGNSSDLFIPQPIKALGGMAIRQIACGDCHCMAITGEGEVHSWGRNQNGQLGLGNNEDAHVPRKVAALQGLKVMMLAAGAEHSAAVTEEGKLYSWGWGRYGNLGLGDRRDRLLPEEVTLLQGEKITMVACGWRHTITVAESSTLFTFGWSKYGQLGHGDFSDHLAPRPVDALAGVNIAKIGGGWRHTVALDDAGRLYAWGWNKFGQIGVGNNEDQNRPQHVEALTEPVEQVSCGWRHTVAITCNANVYAWGRGTSGQLGHGDSVDRFLPKMLEALSADAQACQGLEHSATSVPGGTQWIPPSERYAVVPDETAVSRKPADPFADASVPDTDTKRQRKF